MRSHMLVAFLIAGLSGLNSAYATAIDEEIVIAPGNMLVLDAWAPDTTRVHAVIPGPATITATYEPGGPFLITYRDEDGAARTIQHYPPLQENLLPQSEDLLRALFAQPRYQRIFALPWVAQHLTDPQVLARNEIDVLREALLEWELRWRRIRARAAELAREQLAGRDDVAALAEHAAEYLRHQDDMVLDVRVSEEDLGSTGALLRVRLAGYGWDQYLVRTRPSPPTRPQPFTPREARFELRTLEDLSRTDTTVRVHLNYGNNGDRQMGEIAEQLIQYED